MPLVAFKDTSVRMPAAAGSWWVWHMLTRAAATAPELMDGTMVVTSIQDGSHMSSSLHYIGRAVDIRILGNRMGAIYLRSTDTPRTWVEAVQVQHRFARAWGKRLREKLGTDFDVVVEKDHIHVEYDPH